MFLFLCYPFCFMDGLSSFKSEYIYIYMYRIFSLYKYNLNVCVYIYVYFKVFFPLSSLISLCFFQDAFFVCVFFFFKSIADLQCCISFCCTAKCISYTYPTLVFIFHIRDGPQVSGNSPWSALVYKFIYLFIFGCVGSSFLCEGFLQLRRAGATLHRGARFSHCRGLSCCRARAPDTQAQ